MTAVVTIEARMSASRLPGKMMLPLAGATMLERLVERVRRARNANTVVVATTVAPQDQVISDLCDRRGISVHRGSIEDITGRLLGASEGFDAVVQITGDCPLVDPAHVDQALQLLMSSGADYASNGLNRNTFPLGMDVRCFTRAALEKTADLTSDPIDRIHGSYFIYRNPQIFKLVGWEAPAELCWPDLRVTVDEPVDYEVVRRIYETLYPTNPAFTAQDVVALMRRKPDWVALNGAVQQKSPQQG